MPTHLPPHERLPLLHNRLGSVEETAFGDLYSSPVRERKGSYSFSDIFFSPSEPTPKTGTGRKTYTGLHTRTITDLPAIDESHSILVEQESTLKKRWNEFCYTHLQPTTFVGACMFLLYHVVFCLAMGSSIIREHSETPILGLMTKMAACGVIFCAPVYIYRLGSDIPALYPTIDLFLAPLMGNLASIVDETLRADNSIDGKDEDQVFIATLAVLSGIGMMISGAMLVAASQFKLANLGSYLPFPVLCGFFSVVGIKLWMLAFTVDTDGKSFSRVLRSGDMALIGDSLLHHVPSFFIAVIMRWLGPKNPFYVSMLVVGTVALFYLVMAIMGTSLEEAREKEWFWSRRDLVYDSRVSHFGFDRWAPPAPFGVLNMIAEGKIHWVAVSSSMSTVCALSFLYFLRCSLHGTALKKHVSNLVRPAKEVEILPSPPMRRPSPLLRHRRLFSEAVDIEPTGMSVHDKPEKPVFRAGNCHLSLEKILSEYGHCQFVSALVGSFGIVPSVAVAPTMFSVTTASSHSLSSLCIPSYLFSPRLFASFFGMQLGAEGVAPQYGSVVLLIAFYLTDFQLVGYIPKAAFSSLIVLAFLDIMIVWFVRSYQKTSEKTEWLVVPVIIISAFVVGLLSAVFLGIATSTFLFVASFHRSGVVKFAASGLTIRSTIERDIKSGSWLDENGDLIQILVLQNYLFFGNASSILTYITTMFESHLDLNEDVNFDLPPRTPKFIIIDFTLVTGMDTSTVDVVAGIISVCHSHDCKVFLTGLLPRMHTILSFGGVKPETGERSQRKLRFFPDLDAAIGKAEDMLLDTISNHSKPEVLEGNRRRLISEGDNGFRFALRHIDEQVRRRGKVVCATTPTSRHANPFSLFQSTESSSPRDLLDSKNILLRLNLLRERACSLAMVAL
jgi:MFS superfamily sulfate permease-like transporter